MKRVGKRMQEILDLLNKKRYPIGRLQEMIEEIRGEMPKEQVGRDRLYASYSRAKRKLLEFGLIEWRSYEIVFDYSREELIEIDINKVKKIRPNACVYCGRKIDGGEFCSEHSRQEAWYNLPSNGPLLYGFILSNLEIDAESAISGLKRAFHYDCRIPLELNRLVKILKEEGEYPNVKSHAIPLRLNVCERSKAEGT